MKCMNCQNEIKDTASFCTHCGTKVVKEEIIKLTEEKEPEPETNPSEGPVEEKHPVEEKPKVEKHTGTYNQKQMTIIGSMVGAVIVLILIFVLIGKMGFNHTKRTIMIYMDGSNLESDNAMATAELASLNTDVIDTKNINIIVYTGGAKYWHNNFISSEKNQIYHLEKDGYHLVKEYDQLNMGDPDVLSTFLKYGYDNYKADMYDLILFDHGGAIEGAIHDEISNDLLTIEDFKEAMQDSPFNKDNKLETVYFSTCLNGSIEFANLFKDYANYLIASEETSATTSFTDTFSFINKITSNSKGDTYGKLALERYEEQFKMIDIYGDSVYTYSVIDLSYMDSINEKLTEYINGIDPNANYKKLAYARSQLYEYGNEDNSHYFEMVDLYDFIEKTKAYSKVNGSELQKELKEAVKYNVTNQSTSNGLSIFLPLYSTGKIKEYHMKIYNDLDYSSGYVNFLKKFSSLQTSPAGYSFNVKSNKVGSTEEEKTISIELTTDQRESYLDSEFYIFQRDQEHPDYYSLVLKSDDVTLDNNNLSAKYKDRILQCDDDSTPGKKHIIPTYYFKGEKYVRTTKAALPVTDRVPAKRTTTEKYYHKVTLNFIEKGNKVIISSARMSSINDLINGTFVDLKDYDEYMIYNNRYKILDENGEFMPQEKWEKDPYTRLIYGLLENEEFENTSLEEGQDYYFVFAIKDIYGNTSYSSLTKVGV